MSLRSVHRPHHHLSICHVIVPPVPRSTHRVERFFRCNSFNATTFVLAIRVPLTLVDKRDFYERKKENRLYNMSGMSGTSGTTTTTTTTTTICSTLCSTLVWNRVTGCAARSCGEITRLFHSPPVQEAVYYTLHPFLFHPLFHFSRLLLHSSHWPS